MRMHRVMMVAYHFPPVGGVGVERTLKHATYLPDDGWEAVIVAPSHSAYRIVDPASIERIPAGLEVHRAPTVEPAHLRRLLGALRRRAGATRRAPPGTNAPAASPAGRPGGPLRLRERANAAWSAVVPKLFFPDDQLLWIPAVVIAGMRSHRRAPVDAIYSSAPPISGHLAAAVLARLLRLPWIADFRDPWIGNAFSQRPPALHRAIQRQLERMIVGRADRVIFATDGWRQRYAVRYPELAHRFVHSPNGYDRADLGASNPPPRGAGGPFRLIYPGSIYGQTELELFLDGLAVAIEHDPVLRDTLRVEFVGLLNAHNQAVAQARGAALEPVVSFIGQRPRSEVLAMERGADAGLILIADDPGRDADVNAKLYEYLGLDLPVLAVAPAGETRETLDALGWGVGVDPRPAAIADGLRAIMARPRPDRPADPEGRYDRRRLAAQLAGLLDEISR